MKEKYERNTRTVEGIRGEGEPDISTWDVPRGAGSSDDLQLPPPMGSREATLVEAGSRGATLADDGKDVVAEKAPDTMQYPREGMSKD